MECASTCSSQKDDQKTDAGFPIPFQGTRVMDLLKVELFLVLRNGRARLDGIGAAGVWVSKVLTLEMELITTPKRAVLYR